MNVRAGLQRGAEDDLIESDRHQVGKSGQTDSMD